MSSAMTAKTASAMGAFQLRIRAFSWTIGADAAGAVRVTVTWSPPGARRTSSFVGERTASSGFGSRKMARTSGGAAISSTMIDCTMSTMSIGMPWLACIE